MCVYTNDAEDALLQIEDKWSYKHKALFPLWIPRAGVLVNIDSVHP